MNFALNMNRCAACGSTDVKVENGTYICRTCGEKLDHGMSAGDLEKIQRAVLGGDQKAAQELRAKYSDLDIVTWSSADRLQN
ncbi:MAG: TFIIB-type zinc finger domain-containing protein [Oscillospiraceae bacterium]|nr:TFIIB-type zinc finger domain-containing protein [Oscillospiraceae bacterium]